MADLAAFVEKINKQRREQLLKDQRLEGRERVEQSVAQIHAANVLGYHRSSWLSAIHPKGTQIPERKEARLVGNKGLEVSRD